MARYFQRNVALLAMLCFVFLLMFYAVKIFQRDWNYFSFEKQLNTWQVNSMDNIAVVDDLLAQIKVSSDSNPNLLRMQAKVLEWKAFLDTDNQRFYLYGAEESLQRAIVLRPTDSRNWAHLALIKSKLDRDKQDIERCYLKAKKLGTGDRQTIKILARVFMG